ncbi:MAG TPA: HEAT repeat domain-containing protein [Treponema sp.]|nr:HEAT repeat domain-containing protein [Treponema sp.]HAC31670.1 HEAT repeat domain-containing protein [Treponema sp.]
MKSTKYIACGLAVMMCSFAAVAQSKSNEASVESEYLSSVEDVVITELANSEERDNKLVALQYLENAVNEGRATPDMMKALDSLAGEGITSQARTNGRLVNNFPDIRAKACDILANVKTEESKDTLCKIALADNEPMVITAAIRSLGEIGINNNDEVSETIAWAQKKNAVLNPTSSLALEVLVAFEKIQDTVENKGPMIQAVGQIATNYHYVTPVRTRALELLKKLQGSSSSSSSKSNAK